MSDEQKRDALDTIRAAVLPMLLGVIGFFLISIYQDLRQVRTAIEEIRVTGSGTVERINSNTARLNALERRMDRIQKIAD